MASEPNASSSQVPGRQVTTTATTRGAPGSATIENPERSRSLWRHRGYAWLMADVNFAKAARALEGPAFIAVGFGILGFQRAQVYRRDMEKRRRRANRDGTVVDRGAG